MSTLETWAKLQVDKGKSRGFKAILYSRVEREMIGRCWVYSIRVERRTLKGTHVETMHFCPDHLEVSLYHGSKIRVERTKP